jgi:hypothetical protein
MSTVIERTERQEEKATSRLHHVETLVAKLGNPSEWEHTGVVNDLGRPEGECACGHAIRYEFCLEHPDGRKAVVGSTCIDHFEHINPALYASLKGALDGIREKLAADKRTAREAQQDAEVEKLKAERAPLVDTLIARYKKAKADSYNGYVDNEDIYWGYRVAQQKPKQYKRRCDYIRWYKDSIETLKRYIGEGA